MVGAKFDTSSTRRTRRWRCRCWRRSKREARAKWAVSDVRIAHRLGRLEIGEASVVVAVASPHRAEAFTACRYAIDTLKARVPIWKKEFYADGSVWLDEGDPRTEAIES